MNDLEILLEQKLFDFQNTYTEVFLHALQNFFNLTEQETNQLRTYLPITETTETPNIDNPQYAKLLNKIMMGLITALPKQRTPPPIENIENVLIQQATHLPTHIIRQYFNRENLHKIATAISQYWPHIITRQPNWPQKIMTNLAAAQHINKIQQHPLTSPLR